MMRNAYFMACVAAVGLGGCGNLEVKVDIIDGDYIRTAAEQRDLRQILLLVLDDQNDQVQTRQIEQEKQAVLKVYEDTATRYQKEAGAAGTSAITKDTLTRLAGGLRTKATRELNALYDQFLGRLKEHNADIIAACASLSGDKKSAVRSGKDPVTAPLKQLLIARSETIRRYSAETKTELQGLRSQLPTGLGSVASDLNNALTAAESKVDLVRDSLTVGQTLVGDVNASLVAFAPEDKWSPGCNKALANGILGNVDIAIKMSSLGDFTVKGVSFDPSQVAQVVSKVTTQALVVATQIAGVPVSQGAQTGDGAALSQSSARLAALNKKRINADSEAREGRAALIDIGLAAVQDTSALVAKDDKANNQRRRAAVDAIVASFNQHKKRINFSAPSN